eukprot:TRINITY_DN43368_c0_g1_i1.p4 TRINITY_DN43368_c0_g1~~TRINITY_DN43368_c0_g1_i1.p4  ORF type:complete len:136 (+),score=7.09 TRINITY_DN43368_c0_g1_i1:94-501(+)
MATTGNARADRAADRRDLLETEKDLRREKRAQMRLQAKIEALEKANKELQTTAEDALSEACMRRGWRFTRGPGAGGWACVSLSQLAARLPPLTFALRRSAAQGCSPALALARPPGGGAPAASVGRPAQSLQKQEQ